MVDDRCSARSHTNGTGQGHEQPLNSDQTPQQILLQSLEQQTAESHEAIDYYRTFLARLLDFVSRGQPEAVDRLIDNIRAGASFDQVFQTLSELRPDIGPLDFKE